MYCPKCSQQQSSDEMRYCSRCGFPLGSVGLLLASNGVLPESTQPAGPIRLTRSRIITESLALTVIVTLLGLGATFWFDSGGPFEVIAKMATAIFFLLGLIGLGRFVYAFLLLKEPEGKTTGPQELAANFRTPTALPQPQVPLSDWQRSENTKEIVSRPSVTEGTTRFLNDD